VEPFLQYTESAYLLLTDNSREAPLKVGTVGLLFRVPLLRGLGYESAAAGEIASAFELEAARLNLSHQISFSVHNAAQAFWAYLGAYERLAVSKEAEERARAILGKTEMLVRADELPSAELVNVRANLADKERSGLAAAQAVVAARAGLGVAMGIPSAEIYALPEPHGPFPALDREVLLQATTADNAWYVQTAARHRMDLLASDKQNESLKAGLQAALNRIKPALNLELSLGYDGMESGSSLSRSLRTTAYRQDTPDWSTGARLTYPLGNNSGEGDLEQARARYRQGEMRTQELFRTVQTDIGLVRRDLFSIGQELDRSEEAVRYYTTAVANEREKYLMGETTLLDLLYIEDRRDGALLNRISVRQRVADSLARLRFETGKLVRFEDDQGMVTYGDLTTMLLPEGSQSP
jgi:outer membrane protein TolC